MINMVGDETFFEGDGTVSCCVEISGLPTGGLGCDIEVMLQATNPGGANSAGMRMVLYIIMPHNAKPLIFCV